MGEVIQFPDREQRHLTVGQAALEAGNYLSAIAHLEQVDAHHQSLEVDRLLIQAYMGAHQVQAALPFLSRSMDAFLKTKEDTRMVFEVLLAEPDFRFAWAVLGHVLPEWQAEAKAQITQAEAAMQRDHSDQIEQVAKKLRHLGGFSAHEQEQLLTQMGRLPKATLMAAIPPALTDEDVHPAVRVSLLDALTAVGATQPATIKTYAQTVTVVPHDLSGVMVDATLTAVLSEAGRRLVDEAPQTAAATLDVLRFEVGYLYPAIDKVITDVPAFVDAYLDKAKAPAAWQPLLTWLATQTGELMNFA